MSTEDISVSSPAPGNVAALTLRDDGIVESTASSTMNIMDALANDIRQFKDISFSNPTLGNVTALTRAWREGKDAVLSIKRQFRCVTSSKSYSKDLQKEVMKLETKMVHNAAEVDRLWNGFNHVREWQASAEKALKEARDLLREFEESSKTCCHRTLPDLNCRYQFNRKAEDRIKDIQRLGRLGSEFKGISYSDPAPANVDALTLARREGKVSFPLLETLLISGMDNLKTTWDNQLIANCYHNLKSLCVFRCNKLVNIVPSFILHQLWSLESLEVQYCDSLKVVFELQSPSSQFLLNELVLHGLPRLKRIWDRELSHEVKFQCLRSIIISGCTRLTSLFPASVARGLIQLEELKIDNCGIVVLVEEDRLEEKSINVEAIEGPSHERKVILPFSRCFRHLKTLDVSDCNGLSNLFTPTIAENLVELTKLRIRNCIILTEVISDEDCKKGHAVAFNQLKSLELDGLTWLRCFGSGGHTLMFPLLEDAIVTRCLNMKFFSEGPIQAPKLKKVGVSTTTWSWKENLNITIRNMYEEMATDAEVKSLRLFDLPKQIRKWPNELFSRLESSVVNKCSDINAIPSIVMLALHNIRSLQVRDCEREELFDLERLEDEERTQLLHQLWHLGLVNLPKLRQLWKTNFQRRLCLNSLSHLTLYKCNNLIHAFAPSMIRYLATLEYLEIKECGQMEGVIAKEEKHGSGMEKIIFPNLWWMELEYLPDLTSLLSGKNYMLECPDLKWLTIAHCRKMRSFSEQSLMDNDHGIPSLFTPQVAFPNLETLLITHMNEIEMIWDNQVHFRHLKTLKVSHCNWLSYMFTPAIAENLVKPAELMISDCKMLSKVISDEGGKEESEGTSNQWKNMELDCLTRLRWSAQKEGQGSAMKTIRFPNLLQVELECLPNLNSFFSGNNHTLEWPILEELTIDYCPKMTRVGMLFPRPPSLISRLCTDI